MCLDLSSQTLPRAEKEKADVGKEKTFVPCPLMGHEDHVRFRVFCTDPGYSRTSLQSISMLLTDLGAAILHAELMAKGFRVT